MRPRAACVAGQLLTYCWLLETGSHMPLAGLELVEAHFGLRILFLGVRVTGLCSHPQLKAPPFLE